MKRMLVSGVFELDIAPFYVAHVLFLIFLHTILKRCFSAQSRGLSS